jgi:type I restriction enzyme, S subunit
MNGLLHLCRPTSSAAPEVARRPFLRQSLHSFSRSDRWLCRCFSRDAPEPIPQVPRADLRSRAIRATIVGATYGQAAQVGAFTKFAFQRHIAHLKPNPTQVLPKVLVTMMQLPIVKTQADRWARGAAQPTINLKELKEFLIPVPPLSLQERFAAIVGRVERLRAVQREALRQAEHLFTSLLHSAFSG